MKLTKKISDTFFLLFFFTTLIQSLMFLVGLSVNVFSFIIAILIVLGLDYYKYKKINKELLIALVVVLIAVVGFNLYYLNFNETTYDGAYYHGNAMVEMLNGWNPFLESNNYEVTGVTIWADYYPKVTWIFGAVLMKLFNNLQAPMMINTLVAIGTSLYVYSFLMKKTNKQFLSIILSLVVLLNPITIEQLQTYYVDAILGNLLTISLIMGLDIIDEYSLEKNFMILVISVLLINVKFTGFGFAGIANLFIWIYFLIYDRKSALKYFYFGVAMVLIAVCIIGFSPYLVNLINFRHIFYPIAGKDAQDVVTYLIPDQLMYKSPIYKLKYSVLQGTDVISNLKNFDKPLYYLCDERVGAFGNFFFKMILVSLVGYITKIFDVIKSKKINVGYLLVFIGLVVSIVVNYKNIWWFRYAPQIWLFIPIAMYFLWNNKYLKYLNIALVLMISYQNVHIYLNTTATNLAKSESIMDFYNDNEGKDLTISIKNFDDSDVYWFDAYEVERSARYGVNIKDIEHDEFDSKGKECYHMHVYKVCIVE